MNVLVASILLPIEQLVRLLGGPYGLIIIGGYFFGLIAVERLWYAVARPGLWDDREGASNFVINLMNSALSAAYEFLLPFLAYVWMYAHFSMIGDLPFVLSVVIAFVGHDLSYYWGHRMHHRIGLLWAFHQPHHSSNHFNFTVASRNCWLDGKLPDLLFLLPIAMLGVPPVIWGGVIILKNMWGIFNHARFVPRLGWLERYVATPANHRVHHGSQPQYIDKNYSQVLIIWDRMFGTFEPEGDDVVFGLVKPYYGVNPIKIQLHGIAWLRDRMRSADRWQDKLAYLWMPPEWSHDGRCAECPKYRADASIVLAAT